MKVCQSVLVSISLYFAAILDTFLIRNGIQTENSELLLWYSSSYSVALISRQSFINYLFRQYIKNILSFYTNSNEEKHPLKCQSVIVDKIWRPGFVFYFNNIKISFKIQGVRSSMNVFVLHSLTNVRLISPPLQRKDSFVFWDIYFSNH